MLFRSAMIARYIADHARKLSNSTLSRRLVAIGHAHTAQGHSNPTDALLVRATLKGIRRTVGTAVKQAAALKYEDLLKMVRKLRGLRGKRDAALLLFGFASAMRRSELVALNVEDLQFCEQGVIANIRRSKTDQDQHGRLVAVPRVKADASRRRTRYCPVQHLENWLKAAGITSGALFRSVSRFDQVTPSRLSGQSVSLIGFNTRLPPDLEGDARYFASLDEMLPHCQVLSLNLPGGQGVVMTAALFLLM